jgi:mannose-6-phosphate isomerase
MKTLPILAFAPLMKPTVWGGRRLGHLLGKQLPPATPVGESWEVVDLPGDQSVVAGGPLAGATLADLREQHGGGLLGGAPLLAGRFPLLIKFIDAAQTLSVQVHPDEAACARLGGGARPKTEAWYVIAAEPGALLYVGLDAPVERDRFAAAIADGTVEQLLHRLPVRPGDFVYLPSGTVHAIGAGIVLAEVQQSSDTTYRVFDWNRVGLDGRPRQLHVTQALESIDFAQVGPPAAATPASGNPGISCLDFTMEALGPEPVSARLTGEGPLILMAVSGDGAARVEARDDRAELRGGGTLLVPACRAGEVRVEGAGGLTLLGIRAYSTG